MAEPLRILICDDDAERVEEWAVSLRDRLPDAEIEPFKPVLFAAAVRDLKARMVRAKAGESIDMDEAAIFDSADILVVDSDLTPDKDSTPGDDPDDLVGTYLAGKLGADVADMARAYTRVGAIVVVNQGPKTRTFDLTMTKLAHGVADAYVTDDDIDNAGLWDAKATSGYRPWSWPSLQVLPGLIDEAAAEHRLDSQVLHALGLNNPGIIGAFLARQVEALELSGDTDLAELTFRRIATSSRFGLGLRPKEQTSDALLTRVAVSAVRHWLDRVVLPAQNVIIDLPHLLQQHPWLCAKRTDLASWNCREAWCPPASPAVAPEAYNKAASSLLGRNVWNVPALPARRSNQRAMPTDPVFCEDTSTFTDYGQAVDFLSDLEGAHAQRFVAKVPDVDYAPRSRLLT